VNATEEAWRIVQTGGPVDADRLFDTVTHSELLATRDHRTRLLVRDSLQGLRDFLGPAAFDDRVRSKGVADRVRPFLGEALDDIGFPTLREHLMQPTNPNTVLTMFRELGMCLRADVSITVGGSIALMLDAVIVRHTEDVDIVDELPSPLREDRNTLSALTTRYRLKLTHFQSHYLPDGWHDRTQSLGTFGRLTVRLVDPIDILVGKLFSRRTKDLDDVRLAMPKIDAAALRDRIATSTAAFRRDAGLLTAARQNWYIVTGEDDLPAARP
jgi:hypothetical protein